MKNKTISVRVWANSFHAKTLTNASYPVTLAFMGRLLVGEYHQAITGTTLTHIGYTLWAKGILAESFAYRKDATPIDVSLERFFWSVREAFNRSLALRQWGIETAEVVAIHGPVAAAHALKRALSVHELTFAGSGSRDEEWFSELLEVLNRA